MKTKPTILTVFVPLVNGKAKAYVNIFRNGKSYYYTPSNQSMNRINDWVLSQRYKPNFSMRPYSIKNTVGYVAIIV